MPHRLILNGELVLFGVVGMPSFFEEDEDFTARDVLAALAEPELSGDFTMRINSGGGSAFDGVAIYNAIKAHDGEVTAVVDGVAASAASIIAMGAEEVIMPAGSIMMIHDASALTIGTADTHLHTAALLEKLDSQMAGIYAARGSGDADHFSDLMDAETWLTAEEAIAEGLADRTNAEEADEPAAFLYQIYHNAPEWLPAARFGGDRPDQRVFVGHGSRKVAAQSAVSQPKEDESMTDTPKGSADKPVELTLASLRANHGDLVSQIAAEAAEAERNRILGIEDIAPSGHDQMVSEMKADGKTTPDEAAARILKAEKAQRGAKLEALKAADAEADVEAKPSTEGVKPVKLVVAQTPEGWRDEYEASADLKAEFIDADIYVAYKKAEAEGRAKRFAPAAQSA